MSEPGSAADSYSARAIRLRMDRVAHKGSSSGENSAATKSTSLRIVERLDMTGVIVNCVGMRVRALPLLSDSAHGLGPGLREPFAVPLLRAFLRAPSAAQTESRSAEAQPRNARVSHS